MLKRAIGRWDLLILFINGIIGAGVFGLPSKIFAEVGVFSILAIVACALLVIVLVLNFAEVSTRFNKTGGPYLYTLKAFGRIPGFVLGWLLLITRVATFAALVNLIVTYLTYFIPAAASSPIRESIIIGVTALLTLVNYLGIKNTTRVNNFLGISKMIPLLLFAVVGIFFLDTRVYDFSSNAPDINEFSTSVLLLIFAFTGFESVIVTTGEAKNPQKDLPFALIGAILVVSFFYIIIQIVTIGTLPGLIDSDKPLTDAARQFMGPAGGVIITFGAMLSIGGTLNAVMLVGSRVPFAFSERNQFFPIFKKLHPRFHSPHYSLFLFAGVALLASLSGSFIYAATISAISKIMIFATVSAALIRLRLKKDQETRKAAFKLPGGYIFATIGIVVSLILLYSSEANEFRDVVIAMSVGLILYGIYRIYALKPRKEKV